jgi:hypothetical protein
MKYGAIDIQSDPAGAAVYLDGVDTGNITPFVVTNLSPGTYTVKLDSYHYKYRTETITVNPNETTYINWSLTYAPETTLVIQPDKAEGKDAYVTDNSPDDNTDGEFLLYAGANSTVITRAFIQFNLDLLPENAVIVGASLGLYYYYNAPYSPTSIGVYPVLEAWAESEITWDNQPAFASMPASAQTLPAAATESFRHWQILDLVRGWWDGSITNYGLTLKSTMESSYDGWTGFFSSDYTTFTKRPKLTISYYDPSS